MNRVRSMFAAAFLAAATLSPVGVSACASLGIEQPPAPRTVNEALAETEIALIGFVSLAGHLFERGVIDANEAEAILDFAQSASDTLDTAYALVAAGQTARALATRDAVQSQINARSAKYRGLFYVDRP